MNDQTMERFLLSMQIDDVDSFDLSFHASDPYHKEAETGAWVYHIDKETPWDYEQWCYFQEKLQLLNYPYRLVFHYAQLPSAHDILELLYKWYQSIYRLPLNPLEAEIQDQTITLYFASDLEKEKHHTLLTDFRDFLALLSYPFTIVEELKPMEQAVDLEQEHLATIERVIPALKKAEAQAKRERQAFHRGDYKAYKMHYLDTNSGNVVVEGTIFMKEDYKTSREGKKMATFYMADDTYSVAVRAIEGRSLPLEKLDQCKPSQKIRLKGSVQTDRYSNQLIILAHSLEFLEPDPKREDHAAVKRVELHSHSKMSAMDGVSTITDYCALASSWGHQAIGLCDHGVVQAFPEAQKAAAKYHLKVLYGCEMYMVDEKLNYVKNPSPVQLNQASYVVFDLETTGLSARYDRIIEFGAVRFERGVVVDRFDTLINPGEDFALSERIQQLTNIKPAMLVDAPTIEEVLPRIMDFISDAILVSHNAEFDVGFLDETLRRLGRDALSNPVIDTLSLSRYLFPEARQHNLGALSRNLEVAYEEGKAHRADYDAEVLLQVWLAMLSLLTKDHSELRHEELDQLEASIELLKHARAKHIVVYPKNAQGLKDLFRLISLSHIEYLADLPKIPRREIEKYRENLLLGSACFLGEVFDTAMTRSEKVLKEKIAFYDYIEIQPPANYSFLIDDHQIASMDVLHRYLRDIASASEDLGKPVVATGDVHYLNPEDKIYRDVYIIAKGIGGTRHPLNPFRRENQPYYPNPDQHLRTTDEMLEAFAFLGPDKAFDYVVTNSLAIANSIEELHPIKDHLYTPKIDHCAEDLREICYRKCHEMYGDTLPPIVRDRLERELSGIVKHEYSVIYYIAHKLIKKANEDGFMVGSRGSVGSSLVATMASITEVNPLPPHYRCPHCFHSEFEGLPEVKSGFDLPEKHCPECGHLMIHDGQDIPFATFLGFNAEKVPDIDLNFSGEYQGKAHEMTKELLGAGNVFKAGTIETVAEKTAYGYVLGYFERMGQDPTSIAKAEINRIAVGCQDVKRTTGQHPGGIVVIPQQFDVYDFTPIQFPADEKEATWKTTHFDFHAIHDNVLKLDLLGHVDPTAMKMMKDLTGIDPVDIPMNDPETLSLFSSDKALKRARNYLKEETGALGLPEFGTNFVRGLLKETRPKTFADLLVISGLSHGTDVWNGNAQELISHGTCSLSDVIGCRDDIMVYLSKKGIDPALSFKIMEDVRKGKKLTPEYEKLMKEHEVPQWYIDSCNKIKYMFPKAHATAYVMMAIRVGWYKVHRPLAYYATYFSIRCKQYDLAPMIAGEKAIIKRLEELKEKRYNNKGLASALSAKEQEQEKTLIIALEMAERGYRMANLDLYRSEATTFVVDDETQTIIPPFLTIDGLGANAAYSVVEARKEGEFISKEDLIRRTRLNSQNLTALQELHVLDGLQETDQMDLFSFEF